MPRKPRDRARPERPAIIAQTPGSRDWRPSSAELVTGAAELLDLLGLDASLLPGAVAAGRDFPLRVPRSYVARMRPGDPRDPLLLQVLGQGRELLRVPGFAEDPLDEGGFAPVPGILHKYHGRVLLLVTGACAVHCRYCFRRHFPYEDHLPTPDRLERALEWLAGREDVTEVILSGGDPLAVSDRRLGELVASLSGLAHLKRLRIHTRLPVVMPERVSDALCESLAGARVPVATVVHANHARELDAGVGHALGRLRAAGVTLLNQAVLLAGINDTVEDQVALSEALHAVGVLPYYLHQLDPVAGAAHFGVPDPRALELHAGMQAVLPGYLVPRLVREQPGARSKSWLTPGRG